MIGTGGASATHTAAAAAFPGLTAREKEIVAAFEAGTPLVYGDERPAQTQPSEQVRAALLVWLLARAAGAGGATTGFRLSGVRVDGPLALDGMRVSFPLALTNCVLGPVSVADASLHTLDLSGTACDGIRGDRLTAVRGVLLRNGFRSTGAVWLPNADVGGDVNCTAATFLAKAGERLALMLDGARISGRLFIRRGTYQGVSIQNAQVDGGVSGQDSTFDRAGRTALNLERIRTAGWITLKDATVAGTVAMPAATIGSDLVLDGLTVTSPTQHASVILDRCAIGGRLGLTANCATRVTILDATIGKTLECGANTHLRGDSGWGLDATGTTIEGAIALRRHCVIDGGVSLEVARAGRGMILERGARVSGGDRPGLRLALLSANGNIALKGTLNGTPALSLRSTTVTGDLDLNGLRLETGTNAPPGYPAPVAAHAEGLEVKGTLLGRGLHAASGEVRLARIRVGGDVLFQGLQCGRVVLAGSDIGGRLRLDGVRLTEFDMSATHVGGHMRWCPASLPADALVRLSQASVGELDDRRADWPAAGNLRLDGFVYGGIRGLADEECWLEARLAWVRKHIGGTSDWRPQWMRRRDRASRGYSPAPYEQLMGVLRRGGYEAEAKAVAIAKRTDLRRYGHLRVGGWLWNLIVGAFLGHGFHVWRAVFAAFVVIVVGAAVFDASEMVVVKKPPPAYDSLAYSFDAFFPVINLHQEEYRLPLAGTRAESYLWLHIAVGWALTTFVALGLSGLVRKD